jgi:uncharacterized protein
VSETLSLAEARRIFLAAQGFAKRDRDQSVSWKAMAQELRRLHLLQIDSVNVLVRSHYLPMFSRLGAYDRNTLDAKTLQASGRDVFECWAHEASFVPLEHHPLLRWRTARARRGDGTYVSMDRFGRDEKAFLKRVLKFIASHGPVRQSDIPGGHKGEGGWWGWSKAKLALETLFDQGLITVQRRDGFERVYDLPERVLPQEVLNLPTPRERDAMMTLIDLAGRALGVATEIDLRDYFRLPVAEAKRAITDACAAGMLTPVTVEGWKNSAYLHHAAKVPKSAGGTALVSPFDPLCWNRDRTERLFGFHYRIELYTPAPKRKFGYYVLPFLMGDTFAGRVCLKADRARSTLMVNRMHVEDGCNPEEVAEALSVEFERLAQWLKLSAIEKPRAGNSPAAFAHLQRV